MYLESNVCSYTYTKSRFAEVIDKSFANKLLQRKPHEKHENVQMYAETVRRTE